MTVFFVDCSAYLARILEITRACQNAPDQHKDNGDGVITHSEFVDGIVRCKGPARAMEQASPFAAFDHI